MIDKIEYNGDRQEYSVRLKSVNIDINNISLSIGESESVVDKMEIIKIENIYPREEEISSIVEK